MSIDPAQIILVVMMMIIFGCLFVNYSKESIAYSRLNKVVKDIFYPASDSIVILHRLDDVIRLSPTNRTYQIVDAAFSYYDKLKKNNPAFDYDNKLHSYLTMWYNRL